MPFDVRKPGFLPGSKKNNLEKLDRIRDEVYQIYQSSLIFTKTSAKHNVTLRNVMVKLAKARKQIKGLKTFPESMTDD